MDQEGNYTTVDVNHVSLNCRLQVARPSTALIVVDVQNDFISGSLAISNCPAGQNGEDVSLPGFFETHFLA